MNSSVTADGFLSAWLHPENFSACHDVRFASKDNGFAGVGAELMSNGEAQVAHLTARAVIFGAVTQ